MVLANEELLTEVGLECVIFSEATSSMCGHNQVSLRKQSWSGLQAIIIVLVSMHIPLILTAVQCILFQSCVAIGS